MAKELKVGDRVRVNIGTERYDGTVFEIKRGGENPIVLVKFGGAHPDYTAWSSQCRRLVKKRKEKPPERVGLRSQVTKMDDALKECLCLINDARWTLSNLESGVVDLEEGESICPVGHVPVSEKGLEEALLQARGHCLSPDEFDNVLGIMAKALGLGTEGKKE